MRFTSLAVSPFALEFKQPLVTSKSRYERREGVFIRGLTDCGSIAFGEVSPLPEFSLESLEQAEDELLSCVECLRNRELPRTLSEFAEVLPRNLSPSVRWGLEMLLADALAKAECLPVSKWIYAGARDCVPVNSLLYGNAEEVEEEFRRKLALGVTVFKLKLAPDDLDTKLELLARLSELSTGARFRLDCNQAFASEEIMSVLRTIKEFSNIDYVEEPIKDPTACGLKALREETSVLIALDETLENEKKRLQLLNPEYCDVAILKPMLLGGISAALAVANLASSKGIKVVFTTTLESSLGISACLHTASAFSGSLLHSGLDTSGLFNDGSESSIPLISQGKMHVPLEHGFGITLNGRKWDPI